MAANAFHSIGCWNHVLNWIHENGCALKTEDKGKKEETNLLLNGALGGRLSVPDDKYEQFLRAVVYAVGHDDAWLYIVERQTRPYFKMLAELDIELWDHALTLQEILEDVLPPFVAVMDAAYPDKYPSVLVCTTDPKVVKNCGEDGDGRRLIKSGIHLIWPEVAVDAHTAWKLRAWFLHEISTRAEQKFRPNNGWNAALDPCVFESNGLRMLWSRKSGICPECRGRSRQLLIEERKQRKLKRGGGSESREATIIKRLDIESCSACQNEGKIDLGRPYRVAAVLSSRGADEDARALEELRRDPLYELQAASIRIIPRMTVEDLVRPSISRDVERLINPFEAKPPRSLVKERSKEMQDLATPPAGSRKRAADGVTPPPAALNSVLRDSPAYDIIMQYAEKHLVGGRVTSIKTDTDRHMFLLSTTSRMCLNKGGEHNSSTIYYIMYPDGVVQKCRSRKPVYYHDCKQVSAETRPDLFRAGVMLPPIRCQDFRSDMMRYPKDMADAIAKLFPARYASQFRVVQASKLRSSSVCALDTNSASLAGDLSTQESASSLGCSNLLDYNPSLRDGLSFAEAKKKMMEAREALKAKQ